MGRILIQTVVLLAIALGAGFVHSKVVTVHTRLPDQPPAAAGVPTGPTNPSAPTPKPPVPPPGNTSGSGPSGATGSPLTPAKIPTPTPPPGTPKDETQNWFISVQEAKEIYDKNGAVFVDARTYDEFKEGHVPNSMHMDKKYFDGAAGAIRSRDLKGQAVVIYCHGAECTDSQAVAQRFISLNFQIGPIHIIKDGFPGWKNAGYPVQTGEVGW